MSKPSGHMEQMGYSPSEFAALTSLSKSAVYAGVDRGDIRARRIGTRLVIPASEIARLLGDQPGADA